jgi:hypothetical protein
MKIFILAFCAIILSINLAFANPGDTIYVNTFTFDSINTRRGLFQFPAEQNWEKILMLYTLKCDEATTWDSYPCGEWDYTTYTNIYEHTGNLDSTEYSHKRFTLNNYNFDEFNGTNNPKFHKFEKQYQQTDYNFTSSSDFTVGSNDNYSNIGLTNGDQDSKTYLLYKTQDLLNAGLTAGALVNLKFFTNSTQTFSIPIILKIAETDLDAVDLAGVKNISFTDAYNGILSYTADGEININFNQAFDWSGSSNIIFEISMPNNTNLIDLETQNTVFNSALSSNDTDYFLSFENYSFIDIPASSMASITDQITISFWVYGNPEIQPQNDMLLEAIDANSQRQLCIHYPWSNGNIYWDAGNSANSYDRIDKAAATSEYEGKWNHMAFVKNTTTGSMKIYINGVLWHSGTGMTKPIQNISTFILGCAANKDANYSYDGYIDDFSIWNVELTSEQIQEIMFNRLDNANPNFANLVLYYDFDEIPGTGNQILDKSSNSLNAYFWGTLNRKSYDGINRFKLFGTYQQLPVAQFIQGDFTVDNTTLTYIDSVLLNQQIILEFNNLDFYTIQSVDTALYFPDYELFTDLSNLTDTTFFESDVAIINSDLVYYGHSFEVVNTIQVQNYVTPYGINLTLGNDGFTWVYDVSDYIKYLKNTVDISTHNTQELIDLTFLFIEGTPPRNVLSFNQVYLGNFGQYNIANDISLKPTKIDRNSEAEMFSVKTRTTGHGMEGAGNCAEFCPTYHNISVEGTQRYEWYNWKRCADNPVFPQGGTWIFDRAGWCPGSFADTYDWDITDFVTDPDSVQIDYGMTQYASSNGEGNYNVSVQLIQYGAANFSNDAAVSNVFAPNNADLYKRYNPVCDNPRIEIKNNGSSTLNSLKIEYGIDGDYSYNYQWTGELEFLKVEEVVLPVINWQEFTTDNTFNVRVSLPNETEDEYQYNNEYVTNFSKVDIYTDTIMLVVKTNNYGNETYYKVLDQDGNVLVTRDGLENNVIYYDTLAYPPGCYEIQVFDRGEDGLDFWYYNGADGTGYVKLRKPGDIYVKHFGTDFGSFIQYQFIYPDLSYIVNEELNKKYFEVYPNPNNGTFMVQLNFEPENSTQIIILDMFGREVKKISSNEINSDNFEINLTGLSKGIYLINLTSGKINQNKKLVVE